MYKMKNSEIKYSLGEDKIKQIDLSVKRLMRIKRIRVQKRLKRITYKLFFF